MRRAENYVEISGTRTGFARLSRSIIEERWFLSAFMSEVGVICQSG